jgi:hypothetical protein
LKLVQSLGDPGVTFLGSAITLLLYMFSCSGRGAERVGEPEGRFQRRRIFARLDRGGSLDRATPA